MTITLPDGMRAELEAEARHAGFATVDEYVLVMYQRAKHHDEADSGDNEPDLTPAARQRLLASAEKGRLSPPVPDPRGFLTDLAREAAGGGRVAS